MQKHPTLTLQSALNSVVSRSFHVLVRAYLAIFEYRLSNFDKR